MNGSWDFARILIGVGILLVVVGLAVGLLGRFVRIGRLPGDVFIRRGNFTFYFPLATCLLVSLVLTAIAWALMRR